MENTIKSQINFLISESHELFKEKYNLDLKGVLEDKSLSIGQRFKKFNSQFEASVASLHGDQNFKNNFKIMESDDVTSPAPLNASKLLSLTPAVAAEWASLTGGGIKTAVNAAQALVGTLKTDLTKPNQDIIKALLGSGGIVAVGGGLILTGALTTLGAIISGIAVATAAGTVITSTVIAAISLPAGVILSPSAAFSIAGLAMASGSIPASGLLSAGCSCAAAFMCSPLGLGIIVVAVAAALIALIWWLSTLPRSLSGIIINQSDTDLIAKDLRSPSVSPGSNGLYLDGGELSYFPAHYINSASAPPVFNYWGVPAQVRLPDNSVFAVNVGVFTADNGNSTGAPSGFFTFQFGSNSPVICFFDNPSVTSTGVYIDNYDGTKTASETYSYYDGKRGMGNQGPVPALANIYFLSCALSKSSGADAYAVYVINNPPNII